MLETDPAGLPAHQIALENDRKEMAILGARLLEPQPDVQETLGAVSDAPLRGAIARCKAWRVACQQGLTWALQVQAWWARSHRKHG